MSHTIPSRELAGLPIPIVAIEREDKHICSVNTDNYMGGYQAAGLLAKCSCDILFHINSPCSEAIPASGRIWGFTGFCEEHGLRNKLILRDFGHVHEDVKAQMTDVLELLETAYSPFLGVFPLFPGDIYFFGRFFSILLLWPLA